MHYTLTLVIAAFGLAYALGHSKLTEFPRDKIYLWADERASDHLGGSYARGGALRFAARWFIRLIECPACLGFWTGALWTMHEQWQWRRVIGTEYVLIEVIVNGFAICGVNFVLGALTGLIREPEAPAPKSSISRGYAQDPHNSV